MMIMDVYKLLLSEQYTIDIGIHIVKPSCTNSHHCFHMFQ